MESEAVCFVLSVNQVDDVFALVIGTNVSLGREEMVPSH